MVVLRAPGESTSINLLKDPVTLAGYAGDDSDRPLLSFEWERKADAAATDAMVLQCACLLLSRNRAISRFSLEGAPRTHCIMELLTEYDCPQPYTCRVHSTHVMLMRGASLESTAQTLGINIGDIVFARGHTPLQARRVHWIGFIPREKQPPHKWLREYVPGMQSEWLWGGEAPPLPLADIDSHTSEGEFHEHRSLAHQLGH